MDMRLLATSFDSSRSSRRVSGTTLYVRSISFACMVVAAVSLGCGGNADRAVSRGSTVIIAHQGFNGRGLHPRLSDDERNLIFLPLMNVNQSGGLDGALAESWDYSPETGEVTYHLRTNVRWHDGVPVTAHDVKFSMDLMTHPDVIIEGPGFFGTVEVLDDFTLRARGGHGGTDEMFWPKHLLEDLDPKEFDNWDFWKRPVGNGPYRFVKYQPYSFLELEANPHYFNGKPAIDRVILKFVGDAGVRELMAGNIDAVYGVRPIDALALADDARFDVYYQYQGWWIQGAVYWQHRSPLFEQSDVRRALTLAIDRREIHRLNGVPENTPIVDAPYSRRRLARGQFPDPIPYDPDQAKSLLDQAGWVDNDGNGVREKAGREFRFTSIVSNDPENYQRDTSIYVREQLRRVGVEMEILLTDGAVVVERIRSGDFEAALGPFPPSFVLEFPTQIGYENAELTNLARLYSKRPYQAEALFVDSDPLLDPMHAIFRRDVPITLLGPRIKANIVHQRIRGLSTPWRASPIWHLEHLSISEEPQP